MLKWELAKYLIDAKMDIDTILFIKSYHNKLSNIDLKRKVDSIQMDFYIKLCVILDNTICKKNKKQICVENKIIKDIYYERDKDKAQKDSEYIKKTYSSFNEIINKMKLEISTVKELSNEYLPKNITLDYVPHDKELFRLIFGINKEKEEKINKDKYVKNDVENFNLIKKNIFSDIEDIKYIPENMKHEYAVIVENGINVFEGIQNRQYACIKMNVLHTLNCWCKFNKKNIEKWINLKQEGFIDDFDKPHNIIIWSNEKWKNFYNIVNKEE